MQDINYFLPGQVWQYDTRPGEEASTLTLFCLDTQDDQTIVHVRLDDLSFANGHIGHLPFSAEALLHSLTSFVQHLQTVPDFKEGYEHWKHEFEKGNAGFWKIAVKDALEAIEGIMKKDDLNT